MTARLLVVVSGLPASGKTTVGTVLSERLSLALIDKDAILEALFDSLGCADRNERQRLSRASDEVLFGLAAAADTAVLVNWWNHDSAPSRLQAAGAVVVEVFCDCPVEVAATRFEARIRHPGHHDFRRSPEQLAEDIEHMRKWYRGPLGLNENPVHIDTSRPLDADRVTRRVLAAIEALGSSV